MRIWVYAKYWATPATSNPVECNVEYESDFINFQEARAEVIKQENLNEYSHVVIINIMKNS